MAEVRTEQEPSIEEILESIRQIISEDTEAEPKPDSGPGVDLSVVPQVQDKSDLILKGQTETQDKSDLVLKGETQTQDKSNLVLKGAAEASMDKVVPLVLTEKVTSADKAVSLDLTPPAESSQPSIEIEMMDKPMTDETSPLISPQTAEVATDALSKLLATNVAVETESVGRPGKVTLEEMVRDLMRPLVKAWIDQNLPSIVEKAVQKEVEKLSRRAADR